MEIRVPSLSKKTRTFRTNTHCLITRLQVVLRTSAWPAEAGTLLLNIRSLCQALNPHSLCRASSWCQRWPNNRFGAKTVSWAFQVQLPWRDFSFMDIYGLLKGFPGNSNPHHHLVHGFKRKDPTPVHDILYSYLGDSIKWFLTSELAFWVRFWALKVAGDIGFGLLCARVFLF